MDIIANYILGQIPAQYVVWIAVAVIICSVLDEVLPEATATSPVAYVNFRKLIAFIDNPAILVWAKKNAPVEEKKS